MPSRNPERGGIADSGRESHHRPGWALLIAFTGIVMMALNLRSAVTAVPPLLDRISADLPLNPTVIGALGALPALAFSFAGQAGVRLLRRFPAERIAVVVLLVVAAGQVVRPWTGIVGGFLVVSALTMLAMGVGNVILPMLVKAWFPNRIGQVTAAYTTAMAVGTSVPALIAVPMASRLGWRAGLTLWGLLALLAVPNWWIASRQPRARPTGMTPTSEPTSPNRTTSAAQLTPAPEPTSPNQMTSTTEPMPTTETTSTRTTTPRIALHRSRIAWGLALLFGMNALNLYALFAWLPTRLVDAGATEGRAGAELALFAGIGFVPSLLVPILMARFGRPGLITAVSVGCYVVGYTGLLLAPMTLTSVWCLVAGLGGGGFPLSLTMFGLRSATATTAGALSGFAQSIGYLAAATGPLLVGVLHNLSGGWTASFGFLGVTLVLMLIGAWLCSPATTVDEELGNRVVRGTGGTRTLIR
jgi:CP family cyanate transporter-like MFS transporter